VDVPFLRIPPDAWWLALPAPELPAAHHLAAIRARRGAGPTDLEAAGLRIREWQHAYPRAGHVYGLDDLLSGRLPRTPPFLLPLTYPVSADACEPIALVCVAQRAEEVDLASLEQALGEDARWVVITDIGAYCVSQL
jgi:hypothetical protein